MKAIKHQKRFADFRLSGQNEGPGGQKMIDYTVPGEKLPVHQFLCCDCDQFIVLILCHYSTLQTFLRWVTDGTGASVWPDR